MKRYIPFFQIAFLALLLPLGCGSGTETPAQTQTTAGDDFNSYWYRGEAEISSYKLTQARYGQLHEGKAVFVYVTEDFSDKDHHKINDPIAKKDELVPILKLNMTKDFNTGIYPYKLMKSVFSPVDAAKRPHAMRITGSMQEWCGHAFTQIDETETGWEGEIFSYFESEGDHGFTAGKCWSEDELWVLLRLDPRQLPTGQIDILPSVFYNRLSHRPFAMEKATATHTTEGENGVFTLKYQDFNRELVITYTNSFPYQIQRWTDTYTSGWGPGAKVLTTIGELDKTIMLDYWNRNSPADKKYRKQLNLD